MTADPALLDGLSLAGRVALVTGAGGGIGAATAALLARAGATVLACDLPGRAGPEGTRTVACDLADPAAVKGLVDAVRADPGRLDVLVHAAGVTADAMLWKLEEAAWRRVMAVNVEAAFLLLKGFAPLWRAQGGGSVVLVSSINGTRGKAGQANYAASKAALEALGKTAARELGRQGVRVNAVAPGWIETGMTRALPAEHRQRALDETAVGRVGEPQDVARAVLFLASDWARHVTGQVLRVDGGQLIA
ncbi:MAG: SDR family oxidoreductase [Planctomycetes bacterium]|nr:SDR family oxidoreductase [Planctomycetota bacterium]